MTQPGEPTLLHGADVGWLIESAAGLGRARTLEAVREIVGGMGRVLLDAELTIAEEAPAGPGVEAVPIEGSGGEPLGVLRARRAERFSAEERTILAQLARLTGARLESLRLYEREHRLAATLQASIIPDRLPDVPGILLAAHYSPGNPEAEVGGDWYDVLALPGGPVAIAAGDVVGRGVHAAAIMGQLRNAFRAFLLEGYSPAEALGRLNRLVNTLGDAYFCTVACALIDPARGFARIASAGHAPPVVVRADGSARFQDLVPSIAIGVVEEAAYSDTAVMLHPGDSLLLYTDGLVERRGRSLDDDLQRLLAAAGETGGDPDVLVEHVVRRMAALGEGEDDVAAIALTVSPAPGSRLTLRIPAAPHAVAPLRRRLRAWLAAFDLPEEDLFDVVLAVSEAVANAIEHARDPAEPSIVVTVDPAGGRLALSVRDHGRWSDAPPEEDRGRGLMLISALLEPPTITRTAEGTTVAFRAALPARDRREPPALRDPR